MCGLTVVGIKRECVPQEAAGAIVDVLARVMKRLG
jgi:hypothetical protein